MKRKLIKNSYQVYKHQDNSISPETLRRQAGGQAIRTLRPEGLEPNSNDTMPPYRRQTLDPIDETKPSFGERYIKPVQPLEQVRVPKDLIIMKIAQKQTELARQAARQQSLYQSIQRDSIGRDSPQLFLPPITSRNMSQVRTTKRTSIGPEPSIFDQKTERPNRFSRQALDDSILRPHNASSIIEPVTKTSTEAM